ncbi:MAG: hypothetical protein CM1200mP38_6880 [Dehalococcoidia bacterium]|nr:MAG: hypothetical protein CM1200mP38_6880 [Dehalococcoidia bacterium]
MNQYSTSGMSLDRLKRIDSFIQEKYLNIIDLLEL